MSFGRTLWHAFNARPLGMPIPPNWFAIGVFALLGSFVSPGFWLLGAGLELAYLAALASNARFRRSIAAQNPAQNAETEHYNAALGQLSDSQQQRQQAIEARAREVLQLLSRSPLMTSHAASLEQLVWLHLRLLVAGQALSVVVDTANQESHELLKQEKTLVHRLRSDGLSDELRRSLEQQQQVIDARQAAHSEGLRRQEHVEAELQRIEQQIALIREQTLLATDEEQIGAALNALTSSFNDASRWLNEQRDLLEVLSFDTPKKLPSHVLQQPTKSAAASVKQ